MAAPSARIAAKRHHLWLESPGFSADLGQHCCCHRCKDAPSDDCPIWQDGNKRIGCGWNLLHVSQLTLDSTAVTAIVRPQVMVARAIRTRRTAKRPDSSRSARSHRREQPGMRQYRNRTPPKTDIGSVFHSVSR